MVKKRLQQFNGTSLNLLVVAARCVRRWIETRRSFYLFSCFTLFFFFFVFFFAERSCWWFSQAPARLRAWARRASIGAHQKGRNGIRLASAAEMQIAAAIFRGDLIDQDAVKEGAQQTREAA